MSEYAQVNNEGSVNIYGSTLSGSFAEPLNPPNFTWLPSPLPRGHKYASKVGFWQIVIDELRGPQAQDDKFEKAHAGWSSSSADARFRGYLINPLKTTTTTLSSGSSEGTGGFFWVNFGQVLVMARGDAANISLHKETSTADPTPVAVTYNPGAAICSLFTGPIASGAERLFIGREGTTTDVHTTLGTSAGTMHSDFNSAWGGALSPLNATTPGTPTWLIYCGTTIKTQPITAAIGDASASTALSNVPGGGCVFGFESLIKSPLGNRMYMFWPRSNLTTSWWKGTTIGLRLMHINAEGTDPQEAYLDLAQPQGGRFWQRNFIAHDFTRVVRYDGEQAHDLNIFSNLAANSDIKYSVLRLGGSDAVLRAVIQKWDMGTALSSTLQWWEFMPSTNSWLPVSKEIAILNATTVADGAFFLNGLTVGPAGPNLPYSRQNGAAYIRLQSSLSQSFAHQLVNPQGINPYNVYRKTGTTDYASQAFDDGAWTGPKWQLPGRALGNPSAIDEIDMRMADIDGGGTSTASVTIDIATQSGATPGLTFSNNLSRQFLSAEAISGRIRRDMRSLPEFFQKLQVKATLAQASGQTNKTPNALPIILRGHTCFDGVPRTYEEVMNA